MAPKENLTRIPPVSISRLTADRAKNYLSIASKATMSLANVLLGQHACTRMQACSFGELEGSPGLFSSRLK